MSDGCCNEPHCRRRHPILIRKTGGRWFFVTRMAKTRNGMVVKRQHAVPAMVAELLDHAFPEVDPEVMEGRMETAHELIEAAEAVLHQTNVRLAVGSEHGMRTIEHMHESDEGRCIECGHPWPCATERLRQCIAEIRGDDDL